MIFSINNKEVEQFTNRLREMHRSNLPIVVRQTLNDMAFDAYKNTLPLIYKEKFIIRNKTFLRSHTSVKKAEGWDIDKMHSEVGITPKESESAKGLTKQEFGGSMGKPFIYMRQARLGRSNKRLVSNTNYYNTKYKLNDNSTRKFKSKKAAFVAKVIMSHKLNTPFISDTKGGQTFFSVEKLYLATGGRVNTKLIPIADYERNRKISIKPKHFIEEATLKSYSKQSHFFIKNAKKRFEKALK